MPANPAVNRTLRDEAAPRRLLLHSTRMWAVFFAEQIANKKVAAHSINTLDL